MAEMETEEDRINYEQQMTSTTPNPDAEPTDGQMPNNGPDNGVPFTQDVVFDALQGMGGSTQMGVDVSAAGMSNLTFSEPEQSGTS